MAELGKGGSARHSTSLSTAWWTRPPPILHSGPPRVTNRMTRPRQDEAPHRKLFADSGDGRHPPISCEAGIAIRMPPRGSSRSSSGGGGRSSWLAPSKSHLLSSFFSTLLTPAPLLVFLSITALANMPANILNLPGDRALRAGLWASPNRPRGMHWRCANGLSERPIARKILPADSGPAASNRSRFSMGQRFWHAASMEYRRDMKTDSSVKPNERGGPGIW